MIKEDNNKAFYLALGVSFVLHIIAIGVLSSAKVKNLRKPLKNIEVTYQSVKQKKFVAQNSKFKESKMIKQKHMPKHIKLLDKKNQDNSMFTKKIRDMSKLSRKIRLDKKQTPRLNTLDMNRKITVPLLKSEKITNPRYLSYNQTIRQRIRQQAYSHVDDPDFDSGEVYLTFALSSSGSLKQIKVIEEKTHASAYLKNVGLRSIKESNPFPPFPKELNYPELTFNVVISFEVQEE